MKKLHSNAIWLFFVGSIWRFALYTVVLGTLFFRESLNYVSSSGALGLRGFLIFVAVVISFALVWANLQYQNYKYGFDDKGFRKEHGVIRKKYVSIPYSRIQNVDIYRGVFARMLGLSDLHIQTAGASGVIASEGRLPGVSKEDAESIREDLLKKVTANKDTDQAL